jgi:hypothetical protein
MTERETNTQKQASGQSSPPVRLPYRSPALIEYGSVSKLTEGAFGSRPDAHSGRGLPQMMTCL